MVGERVDEVEVLRRLGGRVQRVGVAADLLEGAGEAFRVAREQRAGGVGEVLALARDGEGDEARDDRREDDADQRDEQDDAGAVAVLVAVASDGSRRRTRSCAAPRSASSASAPISTTTVVMSSVSRLPMCDSSWASTPSSSRRSSFSSRPRVIGDRGVLWVAAGGEGVHRAVLDDVDLGHRQAGADAEVLDQRGRAPAPPLPR